MLEMDEGRMSFPESLCPPSGYRVSFVVGTTYTLDLRALLGVCIPLSLEFEPEALDSVNLVSLFAALQKLQGRMLVYCDKGHIYADVGGDAQSDGLASLLEGMIHQVHVNRQRLDGLSSFHPKVWVVEFEPLEPEGENIYRLIVMSRNLTFDTSWDAAVSIDGRLGVGSDCSRHLADFLEFLATGDSLTDTEMDDIRRRGSHSARVKQLAQSIRDVDFELDGKVFKSVDFLPIGPHVGGEGSLLEAGSISLFHGRYRNILVASPFLSDSYGSPLRTFSERRSGCSGRFMLLSREDSLAKLDSGLRESYECFSPVTWLSDIELEGDGNEAPNAADYSNLHAKIYFTEESNSQRHLYIGSLNASRNGTINNVEALLHLEVKSRYLTFDDFSKSFIGDAKTSGPFAPFAPTSVSDAQESDSGFERLFHAAAKMVEFAHVAVVRENSCLRLDVEVMLNRASKDGAGISYRMRPFLSFSWQEIGAGPNGGTEKLSFGQMKVGQISSLFVLEGSDAEGRVASCILACPHDRFDDQEADFEARSRVLLDSILASNDGSLALYIAHAFGMPEAEYGSDSLRTMTAVGGTDSVAFPQGLYERLLRKAYAEPDSIGRAECLINLISAGVDDGQVDALRRLIRTFRRVVGR